MRIVHVVTLVSDDGAYGGPVSVATGQLGELATRGHRTELVALWRGRTRPPRHRDGVPLRARRARAFLPGMGFLGLLNPALLLDLWRRLGRADVVHVHAGRDLVSLSALAIAALRRCPLVVQTHGMVQPRSGLVARLFDTVYVPLLRRARCALVLTEQERTGLRQVFRKREPEMQRMNNGVPALAAGEGDGPGPPVVVYVARLHPVKRPEAFVEAAALVHRERPEAVFALYGADEGSLEAVRELIVRLGLGDVVRYGGALGHDEAVRRIAGGTVYVLPSSSEVFPMSLMEALAAGTPTVCTDGCGIAPELAAREASVVTDGSPEALAEAVSELLDDEKKRRRLSKAGLRAVRERYSVEAVVDRLEVLYRDA